MATFIFCGAYGLIAAMTAQFHTIGVFGKPGMVAIGKPLARLIDFFNRNSLAVLVDPRTAESLPAKGNFKVLEPEQLAQQADLVVVMGGDGTLLSVARIVAPYRVPLVGINLGQLGFLTDVPLDDMESMLTAILGGVCQFEDRMLLSATVQRGGDQAFAALALNDVVMNRGAIGSMIEFEVFVDDKFVYNLRADGLIVATPTGSTAYALSSGGPILHPSLGALALVPISPHTLSARPIALPSSVSVKLVLVRGVNALAHFDVQSHFALEPGDAVTVMAHKDPIRLLHPKDYSYFAMLREKLRWSERLS